MGNLCSKSSENGDPFAQPGRTLGSATAAQPGRSTVPKQPKIQGPGRTVGGADATLPDDDPRAAAAKAAEARANKAQPKSKLGEKLNRERRQTSLQIQKQASEQERAARIADENAQVRQYN